MGPISPIAARPRASFFWLVVEKLPLLALSAGIVRADHVVQSLAAAFWRLDFPCRLGNAVITYAAYIAQMFYPVGLVAHYPHPGSNLRWQDGAVAVGASRVDYPGRRLAGAATVLT